MYEMAPKTCKYLVSNNFCKYGTDCAFIHHRSIEIESLTKDVKTLKAELDILENTIKMFNINQRKCKYFKEVNGCSKS